MNKFQEFEMKSHAEQRHSELTRLGWRPFQIFKTSWGTWAFWLPVTQRLNLPVLTISKG